ncbi:2Fe-2S iron-sulfur cluster-binding protein [Mucilaginibacter antarcticus]|uniref:2Fe-2S iron-sulfur cluster-binding protein n=1 Tax=Mucilaginibacter antarcticus TaxID=1855725 RepID=A0ABW5XQU0_9SPHI
MALTSFDAIQLKVQDRNGEIRILNIPAEAEYNVMEVLKTFGYKMRATCGGMGLCADCHCKVLEGSDDLPDPTDQELETLDEIPDAAFNSRLSCQIKPGQHLNGVYLHLMPTDYY